MLVRLKVKRSIDLLSRLLVILIWSLVCCLPLVMDARACAVLFELKGTDGNLKVGKKGK